MKKRFVLLVSVLFVCGVFVLAETHAAPVTIRFSASMPGHNFMTKQCVEWGKLVDQNSGGELKVQIFDSAQLYKDNEPHHLDPLLFSRLLPASADL